jgi:flagellar basal-body rod protein FlgC
MGLGLHGFFRGLETASSGLAAERLRMDVIASNIANADVTRGGPGGGPYRRRLVVFEPVMDRALGEMPRGVRVGGVVDDQTPFQVVYRPGHPDADSAGYVRMPNVEVPMEMVDLLTAARGYEADLNALKSLREMIVQTLGIGKG